MKGAKTMKQIYTQAQSNDSSNRRGNAAFLEGKEKGYAQGYSDGYRAGEDEALKRLERMEADED